jgi:AcrR family transcriptional regulator
MTLRDRKRERTRQVLVDVAADLFERKGYAETTVAEIAAAAEIGTRTFFGYFAGKEEILFPYRADRVRIALDEIAARGPQDRPVDVLLRVIGHVVAMDGELMAGIRLRLLRTVPAVQGRVLRIQVAAQRDIARHLREIEAGALVGAFTGAITGALIAVLDSPGAEEDLGARVEQATRTALRPWSG